MFITPERELTQGRCIVSLAKAGHNIKNYHDQGLDFGDYNDKIRCHIIEVGKASYLPATWRRETFTCTSNSSNHIHIHRKKIYQNVLGKPLFEFEKLDSASICMCHAAIDGLSPTTLHPTILFISPVHFSSLPPSLCLRPFHVIVLIPRCQCPSAQDTRASVSEKITSYYGATSTSLKVVSTGLPVRKVGNEYRAKAFGVCMLETWEDQAPRSKSVN